MVVFQLLLLLLLMAAFVWRTRECGGKLGKVEGRTTKGTKGMLLGI